MRPSNRLLTDSNRQPVGSAKDRTVGMLRLMATVVAPLALAAVIACNSTLGSTSTGIPSESTVTPPSLEYLWNPDYRGHFYSPTDESVLYIYMKEPSQDGAERLALQLLGSEHFKEIREVRTLQSDTFPLSQLQKWKALLSQDYLNLERLVARYSNLEGVTPITGGSPPQYDLPRIEIHVGCEEHLEPVQSVVRERLIALKIPLQAVTVKIEPIPYPAIAGFNKLELCGTPHPAGFGGYYHDADDERIVYVYMLHPSPEAAAEIAEFQLGPDYGRYAKKLIPLQGQFTYIQLEQWSGRFHSGLTSHPHPGIQLVPHLTEGGPRYKDQPTLISAYANSRLNRLYFEINREADTKKVRRAIEERLAALDIPREAVIIEVEPPG